MHKLTTRALSMFMAMVMIFTTIPMTVFAGEDNVVEINTLEELVAMTDDGSYKLMNDIVLSDDYKTKINLTGTFDGNGHKITLDGTALFNSIQKSGIVKNLILDGSITYGSSNTGALAFNIYGGTIRNVSSTAKITYTGTSQNYYVGGIVGGINSNSTITNCVSMADHNYGKASYYGSVGVIGFFQKANISNSIGYCNASDTYVASSEGFFGAEEVKSDSLIRIDDSSADLTEYIDMMNNNLQDGDLKWSVKDGVLAPWNTGEDVIEEEPGDHTKLKDAIANAEKTDGFYTKESYEKFKTALEAAIKLDNNLKATQDKLDDAEAKLINAQEELADRDITPVDLSDKEVISITNASQLESLEPGKYYRLENDIDDLGSYWYDYLFHTMDAVLDGNGHTITLKGNYLWKELGENAVIQNLGIKGSVSLNLGNDGGALAASSSGLIINSYSLATVDNSRDAKAVGGFVGKLSSGGAIINSYTAGQLSGKGNIGAFAGKSEGNTLINNSYYQSDIALKFVGENNSQIINSESTPRKDFYSDSFIKLLNDNRNGCMEWSLSKLGYPWHGEKEIYAAANPIDVTFTPNENVNIKQTTFSSAEGFDISLIDMGTTKIIGTISCEKGAHYVVNNSNKTIMIGEETGELAVYGEGSAEISIYDAGWNILGSFTVTVTKGEIQELRLSVNGEAIENNKLTLQGSEQVTLVPQVKNENGEWVDMSPSLFKFTDTGKLYRVGGTIYATEPCTTTVTASGFDQEITIEVTSLYVPVTSIKPAPNGIYKIHGRNANSPSLGTFLDLTLSHQAGSVIIEPENASYRNSWTITSSDNTIAEYITSHSLAIVPYKSGTVTLTATTNDPNLDKQVSGTSEITIVYDNPLANVEITTDEISIEENKTVELPLKYTGANESYEYVTEPEMIWSYEGDGEVEISRDSLGILTGSRNEYCVANYKYKLTGISEGTVTVTGTPVDQTNDIAPVTFTVNVQTGEEEQAADIDKIVKDGISVALDYLTSDKSSYAYGDEWDVFSLIRSNKTISPEAINDYLDSVEATYKSELSQTGTDTKPTTIARVVLALTALGEDASDFRGIDFIDMLINSSRINEGGNEPMWTLIALDCVNYSTASDSKWDRDKLISELIVRYQNPKTGGFGLNDNITESIDMTAMAVQSLAPYYNKRADVKETVDRALDYLRSKMTRNCDFDGTLESAAQVVIALAHMDMDPLDEANGFVKSVARNVITNIASYQVEGGFKHLSSDTRVNRMATIQALLSLESYSRFIAGQYGIYDLTDINPQAVLSSRIEEAKGLDKKNYTEDTWSVLEEALKVAEEVLADENADADMIKSADKTLAEAIAGLKKLQQSGSEVIKPVQYITVSFRLIGDTKHDLVNNHEKYVNWIKTMKVTLPAESTVYDAFKYALEQNNMSFKETQHSYIGSIKAPSVLGGFWLGEFDNGPRSGWKYLVNDNYPSVGLRYYYLEDGDEIVWRYVDDYNNMYDNNDKWDEAEDIKPSSKPNESPVIPPEQEGTREDINNVFKDVETHWANDAITFVYSNKIMNGTSESTFEPNISLSRAMLITMLYRFENEPEVTGENSFTDVKEDSWYTNAVIWAKENGIVNGVGNDKFAPNDSITREQLSVMLYNYSKLKEYDTAHNTDLSKFDDSHSVSGYATDAIKWAHDKELVKGRTESTLVPKGQTTRGEAATVIMRFINNIAK